jgi:mono/diheme cytochrome c family protein
MKASYGVFHRAFAWLLGAAAIVSFSSSSSPAQTETTPVSPRSSTVAVNVSSGSGAKEGTAEHSARVKLYRTHCLECHGSDGRGEPARETTPEIPDFTDTRWHESRTDQDIVRAIWAGKKSMPAMKRKLARTEIDQLVALLRAFQGGKQHIAEVPEKGAQVRPRTELGRVGSHMGQADGVARSRTAGNSPSRKADFDEATAYYQRFCARCHGSTGDGLAMRASFRTIPDFTSRDWHAQRTEGRLKISILEGKGTAMPSFEGKLDASRALRLVAYVRSFAGLSASSDPAPASDFDQWFQKMMRELEELKRDYRTLSPSRTSTLLDRQRTDQLTSRDEVPADGRQRGSQAPGHEQASQ